MIVSLLYRATRTLLSIPGVLLRWDMAKDAELSVLRRQIAGPVPLAEYQDHYNGHRPHRARS